MTANKGNDRKNLPSEPKKTQAGNSSTDKTASKDREQGKKKP